MHTLPVGTDVLETFPRERPVPSPPCHRVEPEASGFVLVDVLVTIRTCTTLTRARTSSLRVRYSGVLTGQLRAQRAPLVDFVPVGYDLDLLEVRLLELYEVVDLFVLYEAPFTHKVPHTGASVRWLDERGERCQCVCV